MKRFASILITISHLFFALVHGFSVHVPGKMRSVGIDVAKTKLSQRQYLHLCMTASDSNDNQGQVGQGNNWIERSFPVNSDETLNPKAVEDYNVGIDGNDFQTGPLSKRMHDAIVQKSSFNVADPDIARALKLYAMDFTAKEAVRAALQQNALEMVLSDDEQDEGMWGDVDSIQLLSSSGQRQDSTFYDSWEDVVDKWTPGQGFSFVTQQVPAKMRELTLDELLQALDPDGDLRKQTKEAGMYMPDEGINSLNDLANENVRRTEKAPRETDRDIFAGGPARGYQVIKASDLLYDSMNADGTENRRTLMHVMDAMVSHGCLIVDLTDGGVTFKQAETIAGMWKTAESFFDAVDQGKAADILPPMQTAEETGSPYAKVGYASYDNGCMQFLETRLNRDGVLLPKETAEIVDTTCLKEAFAIVAAVGKNAVRIAVAASSIEVDALKGADASDAALKLVEELLDDGESLSKKETDVAHDKEGSVCMSPHRLCRYSNSNSTAREVFGAHTDSTFITAVPVAAVPGLEVFDEASERWYRPEVAARKHWEAEQEARGKDAAAVTEEIGDVQLPWHARYVVLMPGELLQLATRNEIMAAVHRVVATNQQSRLSAPVLLRCRPGTIFDIDRYLGGCLQDPLLEECDGMTVEQIHQAMQPTSFQ